MHILTSPLQHDTELNTAMPLHDFAVPYRYYTLPFIALTTQNMAKRYFAALCHYLTLHNIRYPYDTILDITNTQLYILMLYIAAAFQYLTYTKYHIIGIR